MTDISTLSQTTTIADTSKFLMSSAELLAYSTLREKLISEIISDSLSPEADASKALSQVGTTQLLDGYVKSTNNLSEIASPTIARTNLGMPYFTNRNAIINGDFNIWQRGTSFTSVADGTYTADRFRYSKSGTMVNTISRSTDVPTVAQAGRLFNYSLSVTTTTASASIAAGNVCGIEHRIEGYNWLALAQKATTLSFWVKATKVGVYCVRLANAGSDKSNVSEITVNAPDTWEYKTCSFSASPSTGTWDYTTGIGASLGITLASGSNYQTTAGTWQTGNLISTANQVNACDSNSNVFKICGLNLEEGTVATSFENRPIQQELILCHRYYWAETLYVAVTIGGIAVTGVRYPVPMRISPTIAGGGSGFTEVAKNSTGLYYYQSATQATALTFDSEL